MAALLCVGFVALVTQLPGRAQVTPPPDALVFRQNYFLNGDLVVAGVNLKNTNGTGNITISGVPTGTAVAAFLYWQTVLGNNDSLVPTGATFRGQAISAVAVDLNPAGTSPCWSGGGGTGDTGGAKSTHMYVADVLPLLPILTAGIEANGTHAVHFPNTLSGNGTPLTPGASLVVIYRDLAKPLTSIVIYDGSYSMNNAAATSQMTQRITGFYQAAAVPQATLIHIAGMGSEGKTERLLFATGDSAADVPANVIEPDNPFQGLASPVPLANRAWDNITRDVSSHVTAGASEVTTRVVPISSNADCITWGAIIFKVTVQDTDLDGLVDIWEQDNSSSPLTDPNGRELPDLYAMGARDNHKDLFVEVGYMKSTDGWDEATTGQVPTPGPHDHSPGPAVWKLVGDAFKNSGVANPDSTTGIRLHVDAGPDYAAGEAADYIIPASAGPTGGERIEEVACVSDTANPPKWVCPFPEYPGTVLWMFGYQLLKDEWVGTGGEELNQTGQASCATAEADSVTSNDCRRRFDQIRKDIFHWILYSHNLGEPLNPVSTHPDFHVPKPRTGIAAFPGNDSMVTLGQFPDASDLFIATTTAHELGHNLFRSHNGDPALQFDNCHSNYLSVMNYLFQKDGLKDAGGFPVVDFSREALPSLNENSLSESTSLGTTLYQSSWYAPQAGVSNALQTTAAKRHCDGSDLSQAEKDARALGQGMVRVDGTSNVTPPVDWNGNLAMTPAPGTFAQDIDFVANVTSGLTEKKVLTGSADWAAIASIGLSQVGTGASAWGSPGWTPGGGWVPGGGIELDFNAATGTGNPAHSLKGTLGVQGSKTVVNVTWKRPALPNSPGASFKLYKLKGLDVNPINFSKRVVVTTTPGTANCGAGGAIPAPCHVDDKLTPGESYIYIVVVHYPQPDGSVSNATYSKSVTVPK